MSKKIIIVLAIVALGGALIYVNTLTAPEEAEDVLTEESERTEISDSGSLPTPVAGEGTLSELLALNQSLECQIIYEPEGEGVVTDGTYYVSGNKMRGDFVTTTEEGGEYISSMIIDDNTMYTWSIIEGEQYGMTMNLDEMPQSTGEETSAPDTREPVPLDEGVRYDCNPWESVDQSSFTPPTDIVFTDYSEVMQTGMEFGTIYEEGEENTDPCAMCRTLSDSQALNQCLAALGCS